MTSPNFYKVASAITVAEAAKRGEATLFSQEYHQRLLLRLSSYERADKDSLIFIEKKKYLKYIETISAGAVFCSPALANEIPTHMAVLVSNNPYYSFCQVANFLYKTHDTRDVFLPRTVMSSAYIDSRATLESGVVVEAGAYVGPYAHIGRNTIIQSSAVIGPNCTIGRDSLVGYGASVQFAMVGDNVTIHSGARIGQDGFGYLSSSKGLSKIPQIGRVILQNSVEIGANSTIDRGSLNDTIVGEGTKIDNLVQIAHNVQIGRFCLIAAHSGISGSVVMGDYTILGGHVGIKDHIKIGSNVAIAAASGVMNDIPDRERWGGLPARPIKQWFREIITLRNIGIISK